MREPWNGEYIMYEQHESQQRHWLLIIWLIVIAVMNVWSIWKNIQALSFFSSLRQTHGTIISSVEDWIPVFLAMGVANLICVAAIFFWRKWGFWGYVVMSVVGFLVQLQFIIRFGFNDMLGFVWVALLYVALQLGGENRGWLRLR